MEYKVLGVSENASLEDAKRALRRIRIECHTDKLVDAVPAHRKLAQHARELAELAYERLEKKAKKNQRYSLASGGNNAVAAFPSVLTPFDLSNAFHLDPDAYKNGVHHTSTYQYSNVNGEVKESGTVNGRKMTEQELSRSFFRNGLRGIFP